MPLHHSSNSGGIKSNAPFLGASPDGIVTYTNSGKTETGVLEVECPASEKWKALSTEECAKDVDFYCDLDTETGLCWLKPSHKYYFQVQGQMGLTGINRCDFVVWTPGRISVESIMFCEEYWDGMFQKLKNFCQNVFLIELFCRRVMRGLT